MPIRVDLPNGEHLLVESKNLVWLRDKHPKERPFKARSTLQFGDGLVYSSETLGDLLKKFAQPDCKLAQFTPPKQPKEIWVNVSKIVQITPADRSYPRAKAFLKFSIEDKLGVRNTPEEAEAIRAARAAQP